MNNKRQWVRTLVQTAVVATWIACGVQAHAQAADYPSKQVTFIVPFTPGSGTDVSARRVARALFELTGQPFIIENRPGGNNVIGMRAVTSSAADGYTLLFGTNSPVAANVVVYKSLPYDPVKGLAPVAPLSKQDWVLSVSHTSPFKTIEDLVAAAKKDPLLLSAGGGATGYQLAALMFGKIAGVEVNVIPYGGTPQAVQDVIGGRLSFTVTDAGSIMPLVKSGTLRPLVAISENRNALLPDLPTLKESGYSTIPLTSWAGVFAPAGTPKPIIDKLAGLIEKALATPGVQTYYKGIGADTLSGGPDRLRQMQINDIANYRDAMKKTGLPQQ